jgi:hypothetical protein
MIDRGCQAEPLRSWRCLEAGERTRTADPFITNEVLYQLSYAGASASVIAAGWPNAVCVATVKVRVPKRCYSDSASL